ncbi:MAG: PD-(D/E)XK nuclease domain-containing protein, partial [Myxococcota bacterium]
SGRYRIRSNRESGAGRPDLLLLPHDTQKPGIVMEFKVVDSEEKLQQAAQAALDQIKEKDYAAEFADPPERRDAMNHVSTDGKKRTLALGVAFAQKKSAVRHAWIA